MKIKKVLNNNWAVVHHRNEEKIATGLGIAFQKKKNDRVDQSKIEKIFVIKDPSKIEKFEQILASLPEEHIQIAEKIITHAEKELGVTINEHIHIALTDHLSFALDRLAKGASIKNTLLQEIKVLYAKEYGIGLFAKALIQEKLGIEIPDDEVGYIALHIYTAKTNAEEMTRTLDMTSMVRDIVEIIESSLNLNIAEETVAYERLITHLRIAVQRSETGERFYDMGPDMVRIIKSNFQEAYSCAEKAGQYIKEEYGFQFTEAELAYISLQIERTRTRISDKRTPESSGRTDR